ncbi:MAG: HAD family hydrolase [Thermoproteota archaeon]
MNSWFEIIISDVENRLGHIKHALIDFDGTISVIRQGWEDVMIPMMIEMICDGNKPTPEIEHEVKEYVDYSTGMLTIKQMEWLSEKVRQYGVSKQTKDPYEYKRIYNKRLLDHIEDRLTSLERGIFEPDDFMILGSRSFLRSLKDKGVVLYLASGTDHEYVLREAGALKIDDLFNGGIYGALDFTESHDKEKIIQRIMEKYELRGNEFLVVGDGPVEIRNAKAKKAIALGVASDEIKRHGLNSNKRKRLIEAGADIIISDFEKHISLIKYLFKEE